MTNFKTFLTFLQDNQIENEFFQELMNSEDTEDIEEANDIIIDLLDSADKENIFNEGFLFFYEGNNSQSVTNIDWNEINDIYLNRNNTTATEDINIEVTGSVTSYAYFHNISDLSIFSIDSKISFLNKSYKVFSIDKKRTNVYAVLLNKKGVPSKNKYIVVSEKIIENKSNGSHETYGILNNI